MNQVEILQLESKTINIKHSLGGLNKRLHWQKEESVIMNKGQLRLSSLRKKMKKE